MVDITPGNEGANKGFWRVQLRDRFGQFVEMGGMVMFDVELPGVQGKVQGIGFFIGNVEPGVARIEVRDNSRIPKGVYIVKSEDITAIQAKLPDDYVEEKIAEAKGQPEPLKTKISGSEALKTRLRSIARVLKQEGRFPVPRLAPTTDKGQNSDVAKGAKLDYKKVFDAEPALQEKYKTFNNMWETVYRYGADERTQSPNTLAEIPEDMKELNRAYAKHVLGLDPDGLITVYRNAVNGKDTPEESAVGYVSLDREMAYDYNSHRDNVGANGRYEIDVKPEEVFGMIGYSKVEDEYGLTVGRELTNIPGRVRRVGDLEIVDIEAPWLRDYGRNEFNRGRGASPFRMFNIAGEYDFHPVEPFGNNLEEFLQKYNLSASQIKEKFEQLYGEGSYDRYKASGNIVTFQKIRDLFVLLEDGKVGFDVPKFNRLDALRNPNDYLHDIYDNTLKMLSVFQELTGQYFMTHRTRYYTPPEPPETPNTAQESVRKYTDGSGMYSLVNEYLRNGKQDWMDPQKLEEAKQIIDDLTNLINESAGLEEETIVYKGVDEPFAEKLKGLSVGDVLTDDGFLSTSESESVAEGFAFEEGAVMRIFLPEGTKAFSPYEYRTGSKDGDPESELLLAPGTRLQLVEKNGNEYVFDVVQDEPPMYEEVFDGGNIDLEALRKGGERVSKYDREMFSPDQIEALERYSQAGYRQINQLLRQEANLTPEQEELIKLLDASIEENGQLFSAGRVFRGDLPKAGSEYEKFLSNLQEGQTFNFPGYFSTSNDAQLAFSEFGPGIGSGDSDGSAAHLGPSFFWTVDIPEDGKAMAMPDDVGFGQGAESEVLLPRNSKFKVLGIKKVEQLDDEGTPNGNFNYFIHVEQSPAKQSADEPKTQALGDTNWTAPPTDAQKQALEDYGSGELALDANSYLRTGKSYYYPLDEEGDTEFIKEFKENHLKELKEKINDLSSVFEVSTLNKDTTLYRTTEDQALLSLLESNKEDLSKLIGTSYVDKGFVSTSKSRDFAFSGWSSAPIKLSINAKSGQKAVDLLGAIRFDALEREKEIILPPNSEFKISSISFDERDGTYYIEADYLYESSESEPSSENYSTIDYELVDFTEVPVLDTPTPEKRRALMYYAGEGEFIQDVGHHKINTWLRSGEHYPGVKTPDEEKEVLDYINTLREVVNSGVIDKDVKVLRYQNSIPEGLDKVGEVWTSDGFLSTSTATSNGSEVVTAFTYSSVTVEINIPKGSRGGAVGGSVEAEVLLPPGSKFIVQEVKETGFNEKTIKLLLVSQDLSVN